MGSLQYIHPHSSPDLLEFSIPHPNHGLQRSFSSGSDEGVVADCPIFPSAEIESRNEDITDCDFPQLTSSGLPMEDESSSEDDVDMKILHNRVESFCRVGWDVLFLTPMSLASAGFYYAGPMDRVRCAYCGGVLGRWEFGDVPMEEHSRHFPACSFVRSFTQRPVVDPANHIGEDICGIYATFKPTQAVVPEMADFSCRFDSFSPNWPKNRRQRPQDLAGAGLFYTGESDQTRCFHCGGCLEHWDPTDDPWVEHARWYPNCSYLISSKGQRYVSAIIQGRYSSPSGSSGYEEISFSSSQESNSSENSDEDDELKIITEVLRREYKQATVEQALKEKREHLAFARFHSVDELVEAVKDIEERKQLSRRLIEQAKQESSTKEATPTEYEQLLKENERLKKERVCKICLDLNSEISFQPCGHCVTCLKCSGHLNTCPVCRTVILKRERIFLS